MDRPLIEQKLESLRRCIRRIQQKCPETPAALAADADAQDILSLNLTRSVQLSVDIGAHIIAALESPPPNTMGQTFDALAEAGVLPQELAQRLKKAVGFRNIAIHSYEKIDWYIAHVISSQNLGDFADFARAITGFIDSWNQGVGASA
ncbi:MAG: DUF86 domain-containing protein [Gammaproteobacteria bacterium]|nr:DUF86 domain-containing protein [Gammaproteobacteria bacterium]MBU1654641.1 DUF86 domain-containing protein [Gammaproteobacteria bacterium]MBU1960434.1 DUF86 domain-containing protein [Gammaproteobacteria bacterium]